MSKKRSTNKHAGRGRDGARSDVRTAEELVGQADELIGEVLAPGRWPQRRTVDRFLAGDRLERVLSLYGRAMRLDPDEAAYPWNLASTLNRVGLNHLALGFITHAIRVAERVGDTEWSGADAHLALAEIAIDADEPDIALTALARALELNGRIGPHIRRLLRKVREASGEARPEVSLAGRLEQLPA